MIIISENMRLSRDHNKGQKTLSKLLGYANVNVTYNIYVHLYRGGFEKMYSAFVPEK